MVKIGLIMLSVVCKKCKNEVNNLNIYWNIRFFENLCRKVRPPMYLFFEAYQP